MSIEQEEIQKIAYLARLAVDKTEALELGKDLNRILELVAHMNEANTSGVKPMAHPLNILQRLREDVITEGNSRDAYQAIAPLVDQGYYLVRRVID